MKLTLRRRQILEWENITKSFSSPGPKTRVFRYSTAVLYSVLAFGLKQYFGDVIGANAPFLLFFTAITLAAVQGGFGPGLLATIFSAGFIGYFYLPPHFSFVGV